jgi:type II secretory pathway component PulF
MTTHPDSLRPPRVATTLALLALVGLLWAGVVVELTVVAPRYERTFMDFRVRVPWVTEVTLSLSRWLIRFWYVAAPAGLLAAMVVTLASFAIRHLGRSRLLSAAWWALLIVTPLLVSGLIALALYLPMASLVEGLQR